MARLSWLANMSSQFTGLYPYVSQRLIQTQDDRSFSVAGPWVWNCLPAAMRAVEDSEQFKKLLKHICSIEATTPSDFMLLGAVYKLTLLLLIFIIYAVTCVGVFVVCLRLCWRSTRESLRRYTMQHHHQQQHRHRLITTTTTASVSLTALTTLTWSVCLLITMHCCWRYVSCKTTRKLHLPLRVCSPVCQITLQSTNWGSID